MGKVQYEDITCGSLNFTAEIQQTRYDLLCSLAFESPRELI